MLASGPIPPPVTAIKAVLGASPGHRCLGVFWMVDGEVYHNQLWSMFRGMAYGQRVWQWELKIPLAGTLGSTSPAAQKKKGSFSQLICTRPFVDVR